MLMQRRPYLSYLVRLWGEISRGRVVWRAALEGVQSGEQRQFASVESLFACIKAELQTEGQMVAAVMIATIQEGRMDELLILWRTSVAPALQSMPNLSHASLLVDRASHRLMAIAFYTARHAADEAWASGQWQTTFAPLADILHTDSINHEVYDLVDVQDLADEL